MKLSAFKYRLYPTHAQKVLLDKTMGCCRFVYNRALAKKIALYQTEKKTLSMFTLSKELPELKKTTETEWLSEVNAQALQQSLRHLDAAYTRFFREKKGFPKFKSKGNRESFSNPQKTVVDFKSGKISFPKFGEGIPAVLHRKFVGKVKTSTVSRTPTGKYFISVLVELEGDHPIPNEPTEEKTLGIDLGIKTYATLSDGTKIENPKFLAKKLKYLRRQQRRLSRKVKGSANRGKQRQRVAVLHEKVTNTRNDFLHKLTHTLVENQDHESFAVEDLSVQKLQKGKLARHIGDAAWGTFRTMLEYKAIRKGKTVLVIGRFEPSSRLCTCGVINRSLKLSDREWTCDSCGAKHDRDVLAANNIRRLAFCKQDTSKPSVGRDTPEFTLVEPASAGVEARSPRIHSGE